MILYGVEYSGECYCGNFFTTVTRKPEGQCKMKCHGNNAQVCGGSWKMNIYINLNFKTIICSFFEEKKNREKRDWTSSMQTCKSRYPKSYLIGNVSLTNATLACKQLQRTQGGVYWLSIAKEEYMGYDRGVAIDIDERATFHQCQLCNQTGCYFSDCFQKLEYLICEKTSGIEITERRAPFSDSNINLHVIIPSSIGVLILSGCLVMGIICLNGVQNFFFFFA
ncbi:uncharacterized protein LOC134263491 isoform X4 [Saccostrea cucullata]|uniref:uncharacterized protein LOC134263491 isoform X4 n=1 Tax=Saccostrea cuccullata TaxID=36930 RepID=UPI002ED41F4E